MFQLTHYWENDFHRQGASKFLCGDNCCHQRSRLQHVGGATWLSICKCQSSLADDTRSCAWKIHLRDGPYVVHMKDWWFSQTDTLKIGVSSATVNQVWQVRTAWSWHENSPEPCGMPLRPIVNATFSGVWIGVTAICKSIRYIYSYDELTKEDLNFFCSDCWPAIEIDTRYLRQLPRLKRAYSIVH